MAQKKAVAKKVSPKKKSAKGKKSMNQAKLEFQIKRGVIDISGAEDSTLKIINKCITLCQNNKNKAAAELLYQRLRFEWNWSNCASDAKEIFATPQNINVKCTPANCGLSVGEDNGMLIITATFRFTVPIKPGLTGADVSNWLEENAGYACGYFDGGWAYAGSDGDNVYVID